jgi:adenosylmethionine---8-amino-7-oxononanoate aminotransferase
MKHHEDLPLVAIERAQGAVLTDFDGRQYLDAVSSWWTNLFGHNHPRLRAAINKQLNELDHVMLAGFTHRAVVEHAEALIDVAPPGLGHVMYASDGASAVEIALKMSVHYWQQSGRPEKTHFISLAGAYHGETIGALSVTDVPLFRTAYQALTRINFIAAHPQVCGADAALLSLDTLLQTHAETVAAFIVEPLVQGANAMAMHDADFLRQAAALCRNYKVLLIADEIMTGFGRTGTLFACEQAALSPDFLCLSKGITGGTLPLSCVLTTDQVYAAFYDDDVRRGFLHSHSYTGNALACAAAREVLAIFKDEHVIEHNVARAEAITKAAAPIAAHKKVLATRHCGMIWAFDVASDRPHFARWAFEQGLAQGVLLRPIGNTLYWMPPYCLNASEIEQLASASLALLEQA